MPHVAETRGQFFDFIKHAAGDTWVDDWESIDVRLPDVTLPAPESAAAFIITGSASSVYERTDWILRTEGYVRDIAEAKVPLLGICFGHQLIAQALGGEVTKNPRGREIGTVRLEVSQGDAMLEGQPLAFDVQTTHGDSVVRLPPGAKLHASTALEPNAIFSIGDTIRAVQHHPEMDDDIIRKYVQARFEIIQSEGLDAAKILSSVRHAPENARTLRNFIRNFVSKR